MRMIPVIALLASLSINGCGLLPVRTVYVCPDVPRIPRPEVPAIDRSALDHVDRDTLTALADRERLIVGYALETEAALTAIRRHCE